MIVVNGENHYQLTDLGTGEPQVKTELQRAIDNWPPPDGTACDKSPDKKVVDASPGFNNPES